MSEKPTPEELLARAREVRVHVSTFAPLGQMYFMDSDAAHGAFEFDLRPASEKGVLLIVCRPEDEATARQIAKDANANSMLRQIAEMLDMRWPEHSSSADRCSP